MAEATDALSAAAAGALRDKGALTRLMILRIVARGATGPLRQIADEVGVTVQAVSEHLKRLTSDGLVVGTDDGPRITPEGLEALRQHLLSLKEYVDSAVRDLNQVEMTAARAGNALHKGDPVGLFMEGGELVAYSDRESPSTGVADQDAVKGHDVAISALAGIINLESGRVTFGVVPDAAAGGSRVVDMEKVRSACAQAGLVVASGPVAVHLAEAVGVVAVRFGAPHAAVDAALRGVDVLVLVEAGRVDEVKRRFEHARAEWQLDLRIQTEEMA